MRCAASVGMQGEETDPRRDLSRGAGFEVTDSKWSRVAVAVDRGTGTACSTEHRRMSGSIKATGGCCERHALWAQRVSGSLAVQGERLLAESRDR